ncbi:MAG: glycosyl hydrolase [Patescibacteria group bacterium]
MVKSQKKIRWKVILQLTPLFIILVVTFVAVANLQVVRQFFGRASGQPANLVVDVQSDLGQMPRPWRNLAQGGEAFDWSIGPITGKVAALHPNYIRLDHIYDFYDIVKKDGDTLSFDFTKFDVILDQIKATGATPFISLSYMPPAISSGDIISVPNNWADWQLTVQKTIEHVSGTRAIPNVYYEVWNEPDWFGKWTRSGDKNYLTLYSYSARGAANAKNVRPYKFGGPAITNLMKNWFYDFLNFTRKNNLRMDFFSWHRYNTKVEQFEKDISDTQEWLQDFPEYKDKEMVISEWGHDSENNGGYDNSFSAAHTAAVAIQMAGTIDKGFVFEIEDGKDPTGKTYWGRWGLLTNQEFGAQPKPRYQALRLIDRIGEVRLDLLGKGTWVKALAARSVKTDNVNLIIANYDPSSDNVEVVPITFRNIFPGNYTVKQTFLGGSTKIDKIATDSANLRTTVTMPTNSVAFIELSRSGIFSTEEPLSITPIEPASPAATLAPIIPAATTSITPATGFGRLLEP